ncbi:MAG: choice-of-anchor I family protein [Actinobacteria bacterium]|nr:choice-of-anchor I family protein [Actinomycetota bacterium]
MKRINRFPKAIAAISLVALVLPITMSHSASAVTTSGMGLHYLGRWVSGSGVGGAEISAYDPASHRIFVTNGTTNQIDVVDISDPTSPQKVKSIDLAAKGVIGIQSVAAKDGLVAIATSLVSTQSNGRIFFADTNGILVKGAESGIEVGAQPDHVSFSPDGRYVVSANEGEPSSYCLTDGKLPTTTDPYGSISFIDVTGTVPSAATTLNFETYNDRAGAITFQGGRVFGPNATTAQDLEPEYITFSRDSKYAYVTLQENNAIATIDVATKSILEISGLGYKNHSVAGKGLDAIADGTPKVATQNVMGMYQPDHIASLKGADGTDYVVTANEGDARSYACLLGGTSTTTLESEDSKISLVYDSTDTGITAVKDAVGSLVVTPFAPATARAIAVTGSTKVKTAYSFGSRSFSVWRPAKVAGVDTMDQVWDSGDLLETLTAQLNPTGYNSDWNTTNGGPNALESRSTKKGPEPEGVEVGYAYGTQWIVVGMERDGGIALFNGNDPLNPVFVDYINTANRDGNVISGKATATAGDVSPEGIVFVSPEDSPTGSALVIVSYELSGTVGIYEIPSMLPTAPRSVKASASSGKIALSFKTPASLGWKGAVTGYMASCSSPKGKLSKTGTSTKIAITVPAAKRNAIFKCTITPTSIDGNGTKSSVVSVVSK